jgi:hypothetical protein
MDTTTKGVTMTDASTQGTTDPDGNILGLLQDR